MKTSKERQAERALKISLRNNPPKTANAQMRRRDRRAAARLGMEPADALRKFGNAAAETATAMKSLARTSLQKMTVAELRDLCKAQNITTTTKTKKADLVDLLAGD